MTQRPTDKELGELLKTPHFGKGNHLSPSDPITPTPMVLALEQIKPYDRNPRRERNPRYDEIKASIQAQGGLNNPITVTRRPGEALYMVESGGNTRLKILNELYEETGDESFNEIHVLYRPWKSETHVLTAHLIENDKRGEMLFIDKALGIRELKKLFETEEGRDEPYSIRKLTDRLKDAGYAVNTDLLSRMNYAIDILLPVIPEALRAGIGRPQIARIRRIEKAFQHYWEKISQQDVSLFDELFQNSLAEHNRPEWDVDALRQTLEERITELLDIPIRAMRLDIDALLSGREIEITPPPEETPWQPEAAVQTTHDNGDDDREFETTPTDTSNTANTEPETTFAETVTSEEPSPTSPIVTETFDTSYDNEPEEIVDYGITELRQAIYEMAYQLATQYQLAQCVIPSNDWGLGFLIDLPDQPLIPENSQALDAKQRWQHIVRQWIWWLLYVCSEETARPERIPNLPESMTIRRLCLAGDQQELMRRIGQPAWISLSYQLLADPLIPKEHFRHLMTLISRCRALRQQIEDDNDDRLWLERNDHA